MGTYTGGNPKTGAGHVEWTPISWTDDPLVADTLKVKAAHMNELRTNIENLDEHYHTFNSSPTKDSSGEKPSVVVTWAEGIAVNATSIKAAHINEIIGFLKSFKAHYHTVPVGEGGPYNSTTYDPTLTFEVDPIVADVGNPDASAWEQLRTYLESYAAHSHTVDCACECTCTCTCTSTCGCTCNCTCTCACATCG